MKKITTLLITLLISTLSFTQTTNVPDDNFEAYLETHNANGDIVALGAADSMGNGVLNDDTVLTSRIENVTNLDIHNTYSAPVADKISDLTGIEDFVALTSLDCRYNNLTTLDISANIALTSLFCRFNALTTLDVSANTALINLLCENNYLSALDVSQNTSLTSLLCFGNSLTTLNVSNNTSLNKLYCSNNNLTTLNVQNGHNDLLAGYSSGTTPRFQAQNNPDLTCIFVDNATDATAGINDYLHWQIDPTSNYVETMIACNAAYPAPSNNDCANATNLIVGADFDSQAIITTNIGASETVGVEASCGDPNQPEIWFTVTVPNSGSVTIETQEVVGSEFDDSVIAVYSGVCGNLTAIDCNDDDDDGAGLYSKIELTDQTPGEILYITAYSYYSDPFGEFQIAAYDSSVSNISNNTIDGLSLYPNPVKNTLFIKANNTVDAIHIYNMLGQVVLTKSSSFNNLKVDLSTLSSGNYIVKIQSNNQTGTYKLIKN